MAKEFATPVIISPFWQVRGDLLFYRDYSDGFLHERLSPAGVDKLTEIVADRGATHGLALRLQTRATGATSGDSHIISYTFPNPILSSYLIRMRYSYDYTNVPPTLIQELTFGDDIALHHCGVRLDCSTGEIQILNENEVFETVKVVTPNLVLAGFTELEWVISPKKKEYRYLRLDRLKLELGGRRYSTTAGLTAGGATLATKIFTNESKPAALIIDALLVKAE